jgi:hypothetical protein
MPQICDMGQDGFYFSSEGRRAEIFFALKNPTASDGFEPANLGTKGQHATSRPPKPLCPLLTSDINCHTHIQQKAKFTTNFLYVSYVFIYFIFTVINFATWHGLQIHCKKIVMHSNTNAPKCKNI